jgi:hypothetical protein
MSFDIHVGVTGDVNFYLLDAAEFFSNSTPTMCLPTARVPSLIRCCSGAIPRKL